MGEDHNRIASPAKYVLKRGRSYIDAPNIDTLTQFINTNCVPVSTPVVDRAEDWRWGSLWARLHGDQRLKAILSDWPMERPAGWVRLVNEPMTEKKVEGIRTCITRNRHYRKEEWQIQQAKQLGLLHTICHEGRPKAIGEIHHPKN